MNSVPGFFYVLLSEISSNETGQNCDVLLCGITTFPIGG